MMECVASHFIKQPCRKTHHIPGWQSDIGTSEFRL